VAAAVSDQRGAEVLADRIGMQSLQCMQVLHADCAASFVSLCDSNMNHLYFINSR